MHITITHNLSPNFFPCQWIGLSQGSFTFITQLNHLLLSAFSMWPKYNSEIKFRLQCLRFMLNAHDASQQSGKTSVSESCTFRFSFFHFFYVNDHITQDFFLHRQFVIIFLEFVLVSCSYIHTSIENKKKNFQNSKPNRRERFGYFPFVYIYKKAAAWFWQATRFIHVIES